MSVSPRLLENYLSAASVVSRLAVGDRSLGTVENTFKIPTALVQDDRTSDALPFGSRGGISIPYQFPLDGEYRIKVLLKRQLYLYLIGMGEPHQIDIRLDGTLIKRFTIGGEGKGRTAPESFAGNTQGDPEWEVYMHTADDGLTVSLPVTAGTHEVGVSFVRRHWEPEGILQPPQRGFARTTNELYYGNPAVDIVSIAGPYSAKAVEDSPSRRAVFVCRPDPERWATALSRRYARPRMNSAHEPSCRGSLAARIAGRSPKRISRRCSRSTGQGRPRRDSRPESSAGCAGFWPRPASCSASSASRRTCRRAPSIASSDIDLASRLSFFLWSSIPDEELLDAAIRGTLSTPAGLEQQVRRMLADRRSQALVDNFAGQWLTLNKLPGVVPDVDAYPEFDENLRDAFRQETRLFVGAQLREDRSVGELLTANYTYVNERLARHYQIPNVYGSHFRRVTFTDGKRGGLLGQGSILTVTSYPNRTSPVLRGRWLLDNILGAPPPAPPPDVPSLKESARRAAALHPRADGSASQESLVRRVPRAHGSPGLLTREFRRAGQMAYVHRCAADRRVGGASGRNEVRGDCGPPAAGGRAIRRTSRGRSRRSFSGMRSGAASRPRTCPPSARSRGPPPLAAIAGRRSSRASSRSTPFTMSTTRAASDQVPVSTTAARVTAGLRRANDPDVPNPGAGRPESGSPGSR